MVFYYSVCASMVWAVGRVGCRTFGDGNLYVYGRREEGGVMGWKLRMLLRGRLGAISSWDGLDF